MAFNNLPCILKAGANLGGQPAAEAPQGAPLQTPRCSGCTSLRQQCGHRRQSVKPHRGLPLLQLAGAPALLHTSIAQHIDQVTRRRAILLVSWIRTAPYWRTRGLAYLGGQVVGQHSPELAHLGWCGGEGEPALLVAEAGRANPGGDPTRSLLVQYAPIEYITLPLGKFATSFTQFLVRRAPPRPAPPLRCPSTAPTTRSNDGDPSWYVCRNG